MIQVRQTKYLFQLFILGLSTCLAQCGVDEVGTPPPRDALYNPLGLAAHPNGRYLLVSNAVFDRKYNQSFISVIDTFEQKMVGDLSTEVDLFAGEIKLSKVCLGNGGDSANCTERVIGLVSSRDQTTLTSFEVKEESNGIKIHCGQSSGSTKCGDKFIQHSGLLERSSEAPYSISLDQRGAFLSHINVGALSSWDLIDQPPFIKFGCQLQLPGANLLVQHPSTPSVLVSDRFGRSLFHAEKLVQGNRGCQLRLLESSSVYSSALNSEHQGIALNADGSRLYLVSSFDGALKAYATVLEDDGSLFKQLITSVPVGPGANVVRVAGVSSVETLPEGSLSELDRLGEGLIYITSIDSGTLTIIDPLSLEPVSRLKVGRSPHDIAFMLNEAGELRAYVSLFEEHKIIIIDVHPGSATRFTKVGEIK